MTIESIKVNEQNGMICEVSSDTLRYTPLVA